MLYSIAAIIPEARVQPEEVAVRYSIAIRALSL